MKQTMALIIAAALLTATAHAATVYVDNSATGQNNGTSRRDAYTSLAAAIADPAFAGNGKGGCTILVAKGKAEYRGTFILQAQHSGSADNPNTIKAKDGERPLLVGEGKNGLTITKARYIVLEGLEITTAAKGGKERISGVHLAGDLGACTLRGLRIHHAPYAGIMSYASGNIVIEDCICWLNGCLNLYFKRAKAGSEILVDHCVLYKAGGNPDLAPYGECHIYRSPVKSLEIRNTVMVESKKGISFLGALCPGAAANLHHNAHGKKHGWSKGEGEPTVEAWADTDVNLKGVDPGFVAPDKGDFSLRPDSPLMGKASDGAHIGAPPAVAKASAD